jgi:hypothetical protein
MEKKEKNIKVKKEKKYGMKKRRKREKRSGNIDMRGMNQVKKEKNKVQGRMSHC